MVVEMAGNSWDYEECSVFLSCGRADSDYFFNSLCCSRCHEICTGSCERKFKLNGTDIGMCYLGCKDMCVDKCVKGNFEATAPADYCDR